MARSIAPGASDQGFEKKPGVCSAMEPAVWHPCTFGHWLIPARSDSALNGHGKTFVDTLSVGSWGDILVSHDFDSSRSLPVAGRRLCEIISRTGLDTIDDSAQGRAEWWKRGDIGKSWLPLEQAREIAPMRWIKLILVHYPCGYRSSSGRSEWSTGLKAVHLFFVNDHIRQARHFRGVDQVARGNVGHNGELSRNSHCFTWPAGQNLDAEENTSPPILCLASPGTSPHRPVLS